MSASAGDAWSEASLVASWRRVAETPAVLGARVLHASPDLLRLQAAVQRRSLDRNAKRLHRAVLDLAPADLAPKAPPTSWAASESLLSCSPDGHWRLELRKEARTKRGGATSAPEPTPFLDLVSLPDQLLRRTIALEGDGIPHGLLHTHAELGAFAWAPDSASVLYVAEKKRKTLGYSEPAFPPKEDKDAEKAKDREEDKPAQELGVEFVKRESWGEQMTDIKEPALFRLDLTTGKAEAVKGVPEKVTPAFPAFVPDGSGLVFVTFHDAPFRLGKIYCQNRKASIYHLDLKTAECRELAVPGMGEGKAGQCLGPLRWHPDGSGFVLTATDAGGAHGKGSRLVWWDWAQRQGRVLVQTVRQPKDAAAFPGLYSPFLPLRCFQGRRLFLSSLWGASENILSVDLDQTEPQTPRRLTNTDAVTGSFTLTDVWEGWATAVFSSPSQPACLLVGRVSEDAAAPVQLNKVFGPDPVESMTSSLPKFKRALVAGEAELGGPLSAAVTEGAYEGVLVGPAGGGSGLVVMPHGGPHSCSALRWSPWAALLGELGLSVLAVNYRGSLGYGEDCVEGLLGRVGTTDVEDVRHAAETVRDLLKGSLKATVLFGGSHGGFLVSHLGARYPDLFQAVAARNPVIDVSFWAFLFEEVFSAVSALNPVVDLASMVASTDICDWCVVEGLGREYEAGRGLTGAERARLWERSPVAHVDGMRVPYLLLTGAQDARVPPSQANEWLRVLAAKKVATKHLSYPLDCHPLDRVDTETDWVVGTLRWFKQHTTL